MKQSLNDRLEVWKRAARERLLSLLWYDLLIIRTTAESGTEPGKKLMSPTDEKRVELSGDSEDNALCVRKMKAVEDTAHFGWMINDCLEKL